LDIFTKELNDYLFDYINSNTEELVIHEKEGIYYWAFRCMDSEDETEGEGFDNPLDALIDFVEYQKEAMDELYGWHPMHTEEPKMKGS